MAPPRLPKYQIRSRANFDGFLDLTGLSVTALAEKAGLSFRTVSAAINGEPMTWPTTSKLAQALGVAPHALAEPAPNSDSQEATA